MLRDHVVGKWFPAAVDGAGGFHQDFADDWRRLDRGHRRSLVYQARLTWTAAAAGGYAPEGVMRAANRHGVAFLTERQWDARHGGLLWSVDRDGAPAGRWAEEKHSYGQAFAIFAAATSHAVWGDEDALALAKAAFEWLQRHARDTQCGGYFEVLARDGAPVVAAEPHDAVGTAYGLKSSNTLVHLLEAMTALHAVWPAPPVRRALTELTGLVCDRIRPRGGGLPPFFTRNWRPMSRAVSFGHDIEVAHLLVAAGEQLGADETARVLPAARRLVDRAIARGHDQRQGGLFYGRSGRLGRLDRSKTWWVQAEALAALKLMHDRFGAETPDYGRRLRETWGFVQGVQLDRVNGGWHPHVDRDGRPRPGPKSDGWTDPYHQARALLRLAEISGA